MAKQSAGILVYRTKNDTVDPVVSLRDYSSKTNTIPKENSKIYYGVEVFLVHPGGPFWAKKDDYAWSIPKGIYDKDEEPFDAAKREFMEETGQPAPEGEYVELGEIQQKNNKIVTAWAVEKDLGDVKIKSNTFSLEWPPKSGKMLEVPEADRAEWFEISAASRKVHPGQPGLLKRLAEILSVPYTDQSSGSLEDKLNDKQASLL